MHKYYFLLSVSTAFAAFALSVLFGNPYFLALFLPSLYFAYKDSQVLKAKEEHQKDRQKSVYRTEFYQTRTATKYQTTRTPTAPYQRDDAFVVLPYQDPSWTETSEETRRRLESSSSMNSFTDYSTHSSSNDCAPSSSSDSSSSCDTSSSTFD